MLCALAAAFAAARAETDSARYPDWKGQWLRKSAGTFDPDKPPGCGEDEHQVKIGKEQYFLSGDGHLMPTRKDQPPPDLRYFNLSPRR